MQFVAVQYLAVCCSTLQYSGVCSSAVQCSAVQFTMIQFSCRPQCGQFQDWSKNFIVGTGTDQNYERFEIQPYINNKMLGEEDILILRFLRSKSYSAEIHYRKIYNLFLKGSFNCISEKTEITYSRLHIYSTRNEGGKMY